MRHVISETSLAAQLKTKRLASILKASSVSVAVALIASTSLAGATGGWSPDSAQGNIDFTANGLARSAHFNVEQEGNKCALWKVNGAYTFDFELGGSHYLHDAVIKNQSANGNYDISGGYPAGGPFSYKWKGTGNVSASTVTNNVNYTVGAPGTHMDMSGTIAANGIMSGTWSDNFGGGSRSGTWTAASGVATNVFGCKGEGSFRYSDANSDSYKVNNVKYVKVSGNDTWFAGVVSKASQPSWVGNWVFVKVHDGGPPATVGDLVWGSFTDENTAKTGVASMSNPADGPFAVTSGNVKVH